jgi:hypothetical protein
MCWADWFDGIVNFHSTIFDLSAPFSDMLNSRNAVTRRLHSLALNLNVEKIFRP